jgi:hypothetical protein
MSGFETVKTGEYLKKGKLPKQYPIKITDRYLTIDIGYKYNISKQRCNTRDQRWDWLCHFATSKPSVDLYWFKGVLQKACKKWGI